MTIRKVEIERFSVTSSKPFEAVMAVLEAAIGWASGYGRVREGNSGRKDHLLNWKVWSTGASAGQG